MGQLDFLLAWYAKGYRNHRHYIEELQRSGPINHARLPASWWKSFEVHWQGQLTQDGHSVYILRLPHTGGHNSHHLNHSLQGAIGEGGRSGGDVMMLQTNPGQRRAVIVLDHMVGWRAALKHFGGQLPNLGNRSWHVDIFVRPVGWLGTFRKSRETALWFQGKHSIHMKGN